MTRPVELVTVGPYHFSIGDIATAEMTANGLAARGFPVIQVTQPSGSRRCIVGGGYALLLPDNSARQNWVRLLQSHRINGPHVLNAVGVQNAGDWSDLNDYQYLSVRDQCSRELLHAGGVDREIHLVPCPATLVQPLPSDMLSNLWKHERVTRILADCRPLVLRRTPGLEWLNGILRDPTLTVDPAPWEQQKAAWQFEAAPLNHLPEVMAAIVAGSRGVISRSLHLCIFAIAAGVPFLAISFEDRSDRQGAKIARYLERAGLPEAVVDRANLNDRASVFSHLPKVAERIVEIRRSEVIATEQHLDTIADFLR